MAGGFDLLTGGERVGPGDILVCLERAGIGLFRLSNTSEEIFCLESKTMLL